MSGEERSHNALRVRLRLDYKGDRSGGRFLTRNNTQAAEEMREQKAALLRNVPMKGITVEEMDMTTEVYSIFDRDSGKEAIFAPLELTIAADGIEDLVRFIVLPEFRKVEILEPPEITFTDKDLERVLYRIEEELRKYTGLL